MQGFKIDKDELINKITEPDFTKIVFIGQNGVGKTNFLTKIKENLESKGYKTHFISADISMDKEIKNIKDSNLQKMGKEFLNELTNFVFEIEENQLKEFLKNYDDFTNFLEKSNSSINSVWNWLSNSVSTSGEKKQQLIINKDDKNLKPINIKMPDKPLDGNLFEINFNKKMSLGEVFKEIDNSSRPGTGEYFYTLLMLANEILEFSSSVVNKPYYLIIDEPENLCHPELIIKIAKAINKLNNKKIKIVCASHSSIFVNNLIDTLDDLVLIEKSDDYNNFLQYNEEIFLTQVESNINNQLLDLINKFKNEIKKDNINSKTIQYISNHLVSLNKLMEIYSKEKGGFNKWFKNWPLKNDFINALFYKNLILCEGNNDEYFLNSLLLESNIFIFRSFGKFEIPFLKLVFLLFNKNMYIVYDTDITLKETKDDIKINNEFWESINKIIESSFINSKITYYKFPHCLETVLNIKTENKNYMSRLDLLDETNENILKVKKELRESINMFFEYNETNYNNLDYLEEVEIK